MAQTIALLGNPNSGKTSLFNLLSRTHYHVANYPGVTTEYKTSNVKHKGQDLKIIDLPGLYSLETSGYEEELVKKVLKEESIDLIINVLDASNLERNLFLTKELMAKGFPIILALNIFDLAERRGTFTDESKLAQMLCLPIVKTNAKNGEGKLTLLDAIIKYQDKDFSRKALQDLKNSSLLTLPIKETLKRVSQKEQSLDKRFLSDKVDTVLTHKIFGPLFLLAVLYFSYQFVFSVSEYPISLLESLFSFLGDFLSSHLDDGLLKSLIVSGIIDGVGGILSFTPLVLFIFFLISILEDSGYLARMALILDRPFKYFGLEGTSVFPYIISGGIAGGCAVPAVMSCKSIKSMKERLLTMLTLPFMICGAKLPVFALLSSVFFANHKALSLFCITLLAWPLALIGAKILDSFIRDQKSCAFILELPPYRMPTLKNVLLRGIEKTLSYIKKASTIILAASILFWAMMTFPQREDEALKNSFAGKIGVTLEPLSQLAGFDWKLNIALISGVAAKELVVSTLGTVYSLSKEDLEGLEEDDTILSEKMLEDKNINLPQGLSLIVFTMIYFPCLTTLVVIGRETGSFKWPLMIALLNSLVAFLLAVFLYQILRVFL